MAELESRITVAAELRPCIVNGRTALFHRWVERSEVVEPSPLLGGHNGGVVAWAAALVEYTDGTVGEVLPKHIKFIDRDYNFTEREAAKK